MFRDELLDHLQNTLVDVILRFGAPLQIALRDEQRMIAAFYEMSQRL